MEENSPGDFKPLDVSPQGLGSPFNRAQFVLMPRLNYNETAMLFKDYEDARKLTIPDTIKDAIKREAAGHPSSFMTLMRMFDKHRPNEMNWPHKLLIHFEMYMNGLPSKLNEYLRSPGPRELVQGYLSLGTRQWSMNLQALTADERLLFHTGILSIVNDENTTTDQETLVSFTSGLIQRVCLHSVFPKRNIKLDRMLPPIPLLENALRHVRPSQLTMKVSWNLRGPAEHLFQIEIYSVFRDLLPSPWRCTSEVHDANSEDGNPRWRLDLLLLAESTDTPINCGLLRAAGPPKENGVGFELKVDRVSKSEVQEAVDQALKYSRSFGIDVYLINFISRRARQPKLDIIREGNLRVFFVNITYDDNLREFKASYLEESDGNYSKREFKVCRAGDTVGPSR